MQGVEGYSRAATELALKVPADSVIPVVRFSETGQ